MPNQHTQVSCEICFRTVRSDNLKRHIKVHITYTSPEVQVKNSEEICKDIVNDIVDKMFMQENSTLEITHDQATLKRKHDDDDELVDVIGHKKINSFFCSCNKCIHWEKYEECKICNGENICSNEVMNEK